MGGVSLVVEGNDVRRGGWVVMGSGGNGDWGRCGEGAMKSGDLL